MKTMTGALFCTILLGKHVYLHSFSLSLFSPDKDNKKKKIWNEKVMPLLPSNGL